jgi:hypothetical protein
MMERFNRKTIRDIICVIARVVPKIKFVKY